ncbi:MAG TPA: hypothetical protein VFB14_13995 [Bryobacteraceae bacterium]|nr:hypothetical protein [Bryobacteraceae bacterium]
MIEIWQRRKRFKKGYYADAYPQENTLWHLYRNGVSRCGRKSIGEVIGESAETPEDAVCYLCRRQQQIWLPRKQGLAA